MPMLSEGHVVEHQRRRCYPFMLSSTKGLATTIVIPLVDRFTLQCLPYPLPPLHVSCAFVVPIIPFFTAILGICFLLVHFLWSKIGLLYIDSSRTFAKYSSMLHNENTSLSTGSFQGTPKEASSIDGQDENPQKIGHLRRLHSQSSSLFDMDELKLPALKCNSAEESAVLLTGATGFLGSLLLRYLLRYVLIMVECHSTS